MLDRTRKATVLLAAILCLIAAAGCPGKRPPPPKTHSIDTIKLQHLAEQALSDRDGAAVVLDVNTGRVLALVNPGTSLGAAFSVGSALKPLTAVTAVQEGVAAPDRTAPCTGVTSIHGAEYPCWLHGGHGRLNMTEALAQSCNIYFYTLGARLNGPDLIRYAELFGFGKVTGLISSGDSITEDPGRLPDVFTPERVSRLATGDTSDFRATPIQMAVFAVALANGGRVFKPRFEGKPLPVRNVEAARGIVVAQNGMTQCVTSELGTCHSLANMGFPAAGKTGTARRVMDLKTHAWFMGFTPVDEPEAAVVVFLQQGEGSRDAVPIARSIMQAYYQCKEY